MAHTQAIDEATPAGTDSASGGAAQFRNLKRDIRQRMELQHYWNDALTGAEEDGKHVNITIGGSGVTANTALIAAAGGSLTGSDATSFIDVAGTWNTTGTPTAIKLNVTDTASNAASKIIDLQVGGVSTFSVTKGGNLACAADITIAGDLVVSGTGPHAIGGATNDYTRLRLLGNFTSGGAGTTAYGVAVVGTITGHSADSSAIAGMNLDTSLTTAGSATTVAQLYVAEPKITVGSGTVTNSATVYIEAAATEASSNYALLVGAGATKLGGTLECTDTGVASLKVGGGLTIGTGPVTLVGTDGKISGPLSSTIIDNLSGANLTTLNLGRSSNTGTVETARLGSGTASSSTFLRGDQSWAAAVTGLPILQVVSATNATQNAITSTSYVDTNLTASITPASTANKILVLVSQNLVASSVNPGVLSAAGADVQLLRGPSTQIAVMCADGMNQTNEGSGTLTAMIYDAPSSTSSVTYKTQMKVASGGDGDSRVYAQRNSGTSSIVLIELDL